MLPIPSHPISYHTYIMESYTGAVQTPHDAIVLLEASTLGLIKRVKRRLKDTERASIKAGDVFIWNEKEAKMRRWTDGRSWSASRVTGAFLTYREMESGEKSAEQVDKFNSNFRYKQDGLIKQSFSITTSKGEKLHLISYTTTQSFSTSKLMDKTPSKDPVFSGIVIPNDVYPQLGHLMNTSSRSSSQASSPASATTLSSTHTSPITSPKQLAADVSTTARLKQPQQVLPSLSLSISTLPIPTQEEPRSLPQTQLRLPPIQKLSPSTSGVSFPLMRGQLRHDDALALRYLDMSFK